MAKYLDLRVDKVFKAVFAQRAHKSSLIDLLNDLLPELNIRDLTYIRGEMQGYCFDSKSSRFDLCCELDDGTEVTIEMQVGTQKFFKDRAVYYASLPILEEIKAGENYRLTPRYLISFLNFKLDHENESEWKNRVMSSYSLIEPVSGEKLSEAINLVFVELDRFRKGIDELDNDRERWFYVMKHIAQMEERPAEFSDRKFKRIFKVAEYESLPEQAKTEYDKVMTTERDRRNQMAYAIEVATEKGERKGLAKGRAEGHAEGSKEATLKIAKNMKAAGATSAFIASTTGLSEEEISNL